MAFAISAIVACSKSDDLQLIEAQSVEIENLDATNLKINAGQRPPVATPVSKSTWEFKMRTYVGAGSRLDPNSLVYATVNFDTSEGSRSIIVPLSTTGIDDYDAGGSDDYVVQIALPISLINGGWIKLRSANLCLEGTGSLQFHFFSVTMEAPQGNTRITGSTGLFPNIYTTLSQPKGVACYFTGVMDSGTITINELLLH